MNRVLSIQHQSKLQIDNDISACGEQTKSIYIASLGGLSIRVHGKDIGVQAWKSPKVYQLLVMLVAMGGRNIPMGALYDAIWGDIDGDKAMQNMEFILRRLRQTLHQALPMSVASEIKPSQIIQLNHGKVSLNAEYCELDIWAWEYLGEQARTLRQADQCKEACNIERQAVTMLTGQFLAGDEFVLSERRVWHTRLCNWIDEVVGHWRDSAGETDGVTHAEIISLLDVGLLISPASEKLCMQRMHVLLADGYRVDAMRAFKDWAMLVKEAYGIHPSGNIHQVYTAIQHGA